MGIELAKYVLFYVGVVLREMELSLKMQIE